MTLAVVGNVFLKLWWMFTRYTYIDEEIVQMLAEYMFKPSIKTYEKSYKEINYL